MQKFVFFAWGPWLSVCVRDMYCIVLWWGHYKRGSDGQTRKPTRITWVMWILDCDKVIELRVMTHIHNTAHKIPWYYNGTCPSPHISLQAALTLRQDTVGNLAQWHNVLWWAIRPDYCWLAHKANEINSSVEMCTACSAGSVCTVIILHSWCAFSYLFYCMKN